MLTIECEPPTESGPCEYCGGRTTSLTRFVYGNGDAYAIFDARYSDNHSDRAVVATVSLGEWGESTTPDQRVAFVHEIRCEASEYQVGLINAEGSPSREAKVIGRTLDREEALARP